MPGITCSALTTFHTGVRAQPSIASFTRYHVILLPSPDVSRNTQNWRSLGIRFFFQRSDLSSCHIDGFGRHFLVHEHNIEWSVRAVLLWLSGFIDSVYCFLALTCRDDAEASFFNLR